MKPEQIIAGFALAAILASGALSSARAEDGGLKDAGPPRSTGLTPDGGKKLGPVAEGPLPAGHPAIADDGSETDARGESDRADPRKPRGDADPHGGKGGGLPIQAPQDSVLIDPSIPKGTIQIHVADVEGNPIARQPVTLGILFNSIAKGESRRRLEGIADEKGVVTFGDLELGSSVAYRAMILKDSATFAVQPFRLPETSGMRVLLHAYPIEHDVDKTLLFTTSLTYIEVKDDRIQFQQQFKVLNAGKSAWVPIDEVIPLPPEFTAFSTQQGMTDVGVDAVEKKGVRIHGTFSPGQHSLEFRWQLPYTGDAEVAFAFGMSPHMVSSQVIAPAAKAMLLEVEGFPAPQVTTDMLGQRALLTQKELDPKSIRTDKSLTDVKVQIRGLPTEGPGKYIATLLAACGLVIGGWATTKKPTPRDLPAERERLLAELDGLSRAHAQGQLGPKSYERMRRGLLDDLARTYAAEKPTLRAGAKHKKTP